MHRLYSPGLELPGRAEELSKVLRLQDIHTGGVSIQQNCGADSDACGALRHQRHPDVQAQNC